MKKNRDELSMVGWWLSEDARELLLVFDRIDGGEQVTYATAIVSLYPDCSSQIEGDLPVVRSTDDIKAWQAAHNGHEITGCK